MKNTAEEQRNAFYAVRSLKTMFDDYWATPPKSSVERPDQKGWDFLKKWEKQMHDASVEEYK